MPTYIFPITQNRAEALQERGLDTLHAYLVAQGLTVDGVSLSLEPPTIRVEANTDPTPYIAGIPWPVKRNYAPGRTAMKAFMAKLEAGQAPTNAEVVAALRGVIVELARD